MIKLFAALAVALFTQAAHADVVTVDFNSQYDWGTKTISDVASVGTLTLSLNANGTVAAKLDTADTQKWNGVGIDSTWKFGGSANTQGSISGWGVPVGEFESGLACFTGCAGAVSWTITGYEGALTSVRQLLNGGGSNYDAMFIGSNLYVGMAVDAGADVPEPASLALLGLGLAGAAVARRRKSSQQA